MGGSHFLHRAYVRLPLKREFDSACAVLDETEFEGLIKTVSVEEVVEVLSKRGWELGFLAGLREADEELYPPVRLFLEELVTERPYEDIRALVARRSREPTQEGRERLTRAMREYL